MVDGRLGELAAVGAVRSGRGGGGSPELEKMAAVGEGKRAAAAGTRVRQSCGELGPARGGAVAGGGGEGEGVGVGK